MERTGTRVKLGCLVAFAIAVSAFAYWKLTTRTEKPIEVTVAELQKRSMPTGGSWVSKEELDFGKFSVTTTWEIECDQEWGKYCQWIETRFGDFKIEKDVQEKKLHLWKHVLGDTLSMKFEAVGHNPLRVRVAFKGYPS